MKIVLISGLVTIVGFIAFFTGFYWWQFQELPDFMSALTTREELVSETEPQANPPKAAVLPTTNPETDVLGATTQAYVLPSTLYNLINGERRELNAGTLSINSALESAAQRILIMGTQEGQDPLTVAKTLGYSGTDVVLTQVSSEASAWAAFIQLHADARADMLLKSKTFTDVGAALICDDNRDPACSTLVLLGTR